VCVVSVIILMDDAINSVEQDKKTTIG